MVAKQLQNKLIIESKMISIMCERERCINESSSDTIIISIKYYYTNCSLNFQGYVTGRMFYL